MPCHPGRGTGRIGCLDCHVRVPSTDLRAPRLERFADIGRRLDEKVIAHAAQLAAAAAQPAEDLRGSVEYKRDLVRVLTGRALRTALARAEGRR